MGALLVVASALPRSRAIYHKTEANSGYDSKPRDQSELPEHATYQRQWLLFGGLLVIISREPWLPNPATITNSTTKAALELN